MNSRAARADEGEGEVKGATPAHIFCYLLSASPYEILRLRKPLRRVL
jgi:hypothetical protein